MPILRALSWNVNGLRALVKKGFLDWLAKEQPDILCLQETKVVEDQVPMDVRLVPGYHAYFAAPEKKGYSGVALYTKTRPNTVATRFDLPSGTLDEEGRVLIADYGPFVLHNTYFPNGRTGPERLRYKLRFYDLFLEVIERTRRSGKHIVICGDVNTAHKEIDIARPKDNERFSGFLPEERAWVDRLLACGYVDTFRMFNDKPDQYTYWDLFTRARERNVGWRIDYFFVDREFAPRVKAATILSGVLGSDHCPVELRFEIDSS